MVAGPSIYLIGSDSKDSNNLDRALRFYSFVVEVAAQTSSIEESQRVPRCVRVAGLLPKEESAA